MEHNLSVNFQKCFGIKSLQHKFLLSKTKPTIVIYASNGTMKTSFTKTFKAISQKKDPIDLLDSSAPSSATILLDDQNLQSDQIIVVEADQLNENYSASVSKLLVNKQLKDRYDDITNELLKLKKDFLREYSKVAKSSDCETEILRTFSPNNESNFYECLLIMKTRLELGNFYSVDFKFNDIFDNKGKVEQFLKNHSQLLNEYVQRYNELLSQSDFFSKSANFGTYDAEILADALKNESFFLAQHQLHLKNNTCISSAKEYKQLIENQKQSLLNDDTLLKKFERIDNALSKNAELRTFKAIIGKSPEILAELQDYQSFKEKVLVGFLKKMGLTNILLEQYKTKKEALVDIIEAASKEVESWQQIFKVFESRFFVPFKIQISNQKDAVLSLDAPSLTYVYDNHNQMAELTEYEKVLSKGELRAFFILHYLFEIEAGKQSQKPLIVIYDDISDSFDYHNKHAIIEYISDINDLTIQNKSNIYQIILTHNYDFYRTIATRLSACLLMAEKNASGCIELVKGEYSKNYLNYLKRVLANKNSDEFLKKAAFLALIPFVRNLIEYTKKSKDPDYLTLTSCLHLKKERPTVDLISRIFQRTLEIDYLHGINTSVIELIFEVVNHFASRQNVTKADELLEKLVFAIAIRLKLEKIIIKTLGDELTLKDIETNQTRALINMLKTKHNDLFIKYHNVINKVCIMTPEYIHVNSFLYEPLIDTSKEHLINLWKEIETVETFS